MLLCSFHAVCVIFLKAQEMCQGEFNHFHFLFYILIEK